MKLLISELTGGRGKPWAMRHFYNETKLCLWTRRDTSTAGGTGRVRGGDNDKKKRKLNQLRSQKVSWRRSVTQFLMRRGSRVRWQILKKRLICWVAAGKLFNSQWEASEGETYLEKRSAMALFLARVETMDISLAVTLSDWDAHCLRPNGATEAMFVARLSDQSVSSGWLWKEHAS